MRLEKEIIDLLKTRKYAYFDVRDKLRLSEEEYYEMINLDVKKWRIRFGNISMDTEQKERIKKLHGLGKDTNEIAVEMRTLAKNVRETLKGFGIKPKVVKKQFSKCNRTHEIESKICRLHEIGLTAPLICVEIEYVFRTTKSITDILKKYNRKMQDNKDKELHVNSHIFNFIDTEEKAYWLGMMITDGWIYNRSNNYTIGLCLDEEDKYVIEKFKDFLGTPNKLLRKTATRKDGSISVSYTLMVTSKIMFEDLKRYGVVERKSYNTSPNLELIPKHLQHHFWRGCFDGDGCFYYNSGGKLTFAYIGTFDIAYKFLAWLYHEAGTREFKTPYKRSVEELRSRGENANVDMYYFSFSHTDDIDVIRRALYKDATVFMNRKYSLSNIKDKPV